jgi:hypothetical protein
VNADLGEGWGLGMVSFLVDQWMVDAFVSGFLILRVRYMGVVCENFCWVGL